MNNFYNFISRLFVTILVLLLIFFTLSSSYSSKQLDKLAYVIALGMDVGENNNLKLSIQLAKPSSRFLFFFFPVFVISCQFGRVF